MSGKSRCLAITATADDAGEQFRVDHMKCTAIVSPTWCDSAHGIAKSKCPNAQHSPE